MSEFKTKLESELVDQQAAQGRGTWKLLSDLVYQSDVASSIIAVPSGFVTDYASVPRLPIIFTLVGDIASEAAVVHDHLYKTKALSRPLADKVLKEAALVVGCPKWQAWTLYIGVRIGGASRYGR